MSAPDRAFVGAAIHRWESVRNHDLKLPKAPLPLLVFFDERCVWRGDAATKHEGMIGIPGGGEIPARVTSFAGVDDQGAPFLVMALPSVWRAEERHRNDPRLDLLLRVVFVHEMTHTRQARAFSVRLDEIEAKHAIELDDDIVQARFGEREGFREAYEKERDLLFAVPSKRIAREALGLANERRARFFAGTDAVYAELETIFLGMEGVANWAGMRAAVREGLTREDAIAFMRRGGKRWSQDEGLALFLVIDALVPRWQVRVFRENDPVPVWTLLEEASSR